MSWRGDCSLWGKSSSVVSVSGVVDGECGSCDWRRLSCVSRESDPLRLLGRAAMRLGRIFEASEMDEDELPALGRWWWSLLLVLSTMDRERSLPDLDSSLDSFEPCGVGGGDWDCLGDVEDVADMRRKGSSPS